LGGVSGRSSSYRAEEQSFGQRVERGGGRHPGSREAGSLRGEPVECGPRSVHVVCRRILSCGREHRRQRMSGGRRGGEPRSHATFQGACTGRKGNLKTPLAPRETKSFSRSSDPYTSILTMLRGRKLSEVGRRQGHHGWENSRKREEPSLGSRSLDVVRLAACHRSSPPAREGA
jgi:hypothetical protein